MRKLIVTLCGGALLAGGISVRALAADNKPAGGDKDTTVTGELVDTHCYAAGGATGEQHGQTCGGACAKSGIPVAVLADGKAWTLATNPVPLASAVGKQVRVTGTQSSESQVMVPEKVEVKDGENWKEVKMKDAHHKGGADDKSTDQK
jgi:hypothetical protein